LLRIAATLLPILSIRLPSSPLSYLSFPSTSLSSSCNKGEIGWGLEGDEEDPPEDGEGAVVDEENLDEVSDADEAISTPAAVDPSDPQFDIDENMGLSESQHVMFDSGSELANLKDHCFKSFVLDEVDKGGEGLSAFGKNDTAGARPSRSKAAAIALNTWCGSKWNIRKLMVSSLIFFLLPSLPLSFLPLLLPSLPPSFLPLLPYLIPSSPQHAKAIDNVCADHEDWKQRRKLHDLDSKTAGRYIEAVANKAFPTDDQRKRRVAYSKELQSARKKYLRVS